MFPRKPTDIEIPTRNDKDVDAETQEGWSESEWSAISLNSKESKSYEKIPDKTRIHDNKSWWRRIVSKVGMYLTPINIVAFGITFIGATIELLRIREKANDPGWYSISKEHAEEIKSCLSEYMPKASWGEALSTLFLDDWWSWEIIGWACAVGLPVLILVSASEKYKIYQKIQDMLCERKEKRTICQLEPNAENLATSLNKILSEAQEDVDDLKNRILSVLNQPSSIENSTDNDRRISIIDNNLQEILGRNNMSREQIIAAIMAAIKPYTKEENDAPIAFDEIQNAIPAKTVWRNSYKEILFTITPKIGLNFSFLFFALYELIVGNHYAKKYVHVVPVILDQLKHDPKYRFFDRACLDVISRALATDKIYNINAKLVSLLVPAIVILVVETCVVSPKLIKRFRGSTSEEEIRLMEDAKLTYGTDEHDVNNDEPNQHLNLDVLP